MAHRRRNTWVRLGLFTAAVGAIAAVGLAPTAASARDGGGDGGRDWGVVYDGSVRYINHCPELYNAKNTAVTSMDATDSQRGCQASYNGGEEVLRSDCSRTRNDRGSWFYKPQGQYAAEGDGAVFNGSFHEQNQIDVSNFSSTTCAFRSKRSLVSVESDQPARSIRSP